MSPDQENSFNQLSYSAHSKSSVDDLAGNFEVYRNWFERNTVDLWRHKRFFEVLDHFLSSEINSSWITIGDGRFGTSARYIETKGSTALATDICVDMLEYAHKGGVLRAFAFANAEQLPFADNSFDYSYCKQAYHHFPRPQIALYEMIRVSKKAVILTEPADWIPEPALRKVLKGLKKILRRLSGGKPQHHDNGNYEPAGNYIFTLSEREIEKSALAMNLPAVAFKRLQDVYIPGVEEEQLNDNGPLLRKIKRKLLIHEIKRAICLDRSNNMQCIIFKEIPTSAQISSLRENGYSYIPLPRNPYV